MTNLIFDLNNIAHRSLFIVSGYGKNAYSFDSQDEIDQLMRKMAMDIAQIIRTVNSSRIIFALDSKSWRKQIVIDENEGYKGTRTKTSQINWNNIYNALTEFSEIMENNGMTVTKIENAEADDIIALWSHELQYNQAQHVIIVSGDEDMRQLVRGFPVDAANDKWVFTTVFNPFTQGKNASKKLFAPHNFHNWLNAVAPVDFMHMKASVDIDREDFNKIITGERTKLEQIDGRMIGLRKLFCGDDGDNVPAMYSWLNEKGVMVRLTNSKFEKIYEMLLESPTELMDHLDIIDRSKKVLEAVSKVCKSTPTFDIDARIDRQIKLVILDSAFFPESITDKFNEIKTIELAKPYANRGGINMHNLLEGTRYVNPNSKYNKPNRSEAGIFKEIDRIKANSLF